MSRSFMGFFGTFGAGALGVFGGSAGSTGSACSIGRYGSARMAAVHPRILDEDAVAERAARLAGGWRARGLVAGDRVAVRAGNGLDFVAARDAATGLGLVFVPVNP